MNLGRWFLFIILLALPLTYNQCKGVAPTSETLPSQEGTTNGTPLIPLRVAPLAGYENVHLSFCLTEIRAQRLDDTWASLWSGPGHTVEVKSEHTELPAISVPRESFKRIQFVSRPLCSGLLGEMSLVNDHGSFWLNFGESTLNFEGSIFDGSNLSALFLEFSTFFAVLAEVETENAFGAALANTIGVASSETALPTLPVKFMADPILVTYGQTSTQSPRLSYRFCIVEMGARRSGKTVYSTIWTGSQQLDLNPSGTEFTNVQLPIGLYDGFSLKLSPACGHSSAVRFSNQNGDYDSTPGDITLFLGGGFNRVNTGGVLLFRQTWAGQYIGISSVSALDAQLTLGWGGICSTDHSWCIP